MGTTAYVSFDIRTLTNIGYISLEMKKKGDISCISMNIGQKVIWPIHPLILGEKVT